MLNGYGEFVGCMDSWLSANVWMRGGIVPIYKGKGRKLLHELQRMINPLHSIIHVVGLRINVLAGLLNPLQARKTEDLGRDEGVYIGFLVLRKVPKETHHKIDITIGIYVFRKCA